MADNLIFQTEKQVKEFGEKLTEEDKSAINTDLDSLKKAHSDKDVAKIDETSQKLNETWSTISTRLYQESSQQPGEDNSNPNDEVQDADFEEVK